MYMIYMYCLGCGFGKFIVVWLEDNIIEYNNKKMLYFDRLLKDFIVKDFKGKSFNKLKCFVVDKKLKMGFKEVSY